MKILYCAGNIYGANIRLSHFLKHTKDEVKIAAFYKEHEYLDKIHWTLDAIQSNRISKNVKQLVKSKLSVNDNFLILLDDIIKYNPDLIITDYEFTAPVISEIIGVPFISCSPLHLYDGTVFPNKKLFNIQMDAFKSAKKKYVYSCFGSFGLELLDTFEYCTPYPCSFKYKSNNTLNYLKSINSEYTTGNSQEIYNILLNNNGVCVQEIAANIESSLNANLIQHFGLGVSIGLGKNKKILQDKLYELSKLKKSYSMAEPLFLHERLLHDI